MHSINPHSLPRVLLATALLCGLLAVSACSKKDDTKAATQVAAKVGSEEISVHQINQVLSRANTNGASPDAVKAMSREVLEKLIDQQLAVDEATEAKLHRSPEVVAQIEAAKRDILARAYLQQLTAGLPKPGPDDVKKYFAEHPALFAERRVFNVQELVVPGGAAVLDTLRSLAAAGKPMDDIAATLKAKSVEYKAGAATRAAEQIPLELLPRIHALKDGQTTVLESAQGVTVVHLASSQSSPVPEAAALPRIEQFLTNQRASEAVAAKLKALRAAAKISYQGEFADASVAAPAAPRNAANPAAAPANPAQAAIEKGVAGLK